jgi:hypothetical protein
VYADLDLSAKNPLDGASLYRDGTLFHGESFQGVERVLSVSTEKLVMQCRSRRIDERVQGQFPIQTFNPFTADVAFQAMVIWARQIYDAASLPLSAGGGEQYRILPPDTVFFVTMEVVKHDSTGLVANIITHDEAGVMYSQVFGAEVTISKELNKLFKS